MCSFKNRSATCPFSAGFKLQVEYASTPPSFTCRAACSKMVNCSSGNPSSVLGSLYRISGFRPIMPKPAQGASHRTRSAFSRASSGLVESSNPCFYIGKGKPFRTLANQADLSFIFIKGKNGSRSLHQFCHGKGFAAGRSA